MWSDEPTVITCDDFLPVLGSSVETCSVSSAPRIHFVQAFIVDKKNLHESHRLTSLGEYRFRIKTAAVNIYWAKFVPNTY